MAVGYNARLTIVDNVYTISEIKNLLILDNYANRDSQRQHSYQDAVAANPGRAIHRHHITGILDNSGQPNRNGNIYPPNSIAGGITRQSLNDAFRIINEYNYNWRQHHNVPMNFNREAVEQLFANYNDADIFTDQVKDEVLERAEDVNWVKEGF